MLSITLADRSVVWVHRLSACGSFLRSSRPNIRLFGLAPVYALIPLRTSSRSGLPCNAAILAVRLFLILCIHLSTSPLASGHPGVTLLKRPLGELADHFNTRCLVAFLLFHQLVVFGAIHNVFLLLLFTATSTASTTATLFRSNLSRSF